MKLTLQILGFGLLISTLSSCDVGGGAYMGARPGYDHPRHYHNNYNDGYYNNRSYGHNHPTYNQSRPAPRPSGVDARVNARVLPLNVSNSTRLGIF